MKEHQSTEDAAKTDRENEEKIVVKLTTTDSNRVFSFWKMALAWSAVIGVIIVISIIINMAVYAE
ncbi:hypothetical protein GP5015_1185 [gamma proteobacterium HTCC5015]|nr:hypothetical protein GP5015_1185 [gamma proteobacterium HTCC5015]